MYRLCTAVHQAVQDGIFRFGDIMSIPDDELAGLFAGKWNSTARLIPAAACGGSEALHNKLLRALCRARGSTCAENMRRRLLGDQQFTERQIQDAQDCIVMLLHRRALRA